MGVNKIFKVVLRIILLPLFIMGLFFSKTRLKSWHVIRKNFLYFIILIVIIISLVLIFPTEKLGPNLLEDGSFELGTWKEVKDCCKNWPGNASVSASQSADAYDGEYSLKLESSNHCACVSQSIGNLSLEKDYKLSFNYKNMGGDNPDFCLYDEGCKSCIIKEILPKNKNWNLYKKTFKVLNCSKELIPHFYSRSEGSITTINLYDQVKIQEIIKDEKNN